SFGRGFGPRRSIGTLQLSTRCSSLALPLRRSLAVPVGWTWLALPSAAGGAAGAANATSRIGVVTKRRGARHLIRGELGIREPFVSTVFARCAARAGISQTAFKRVVHSKLTTA